MRILAPLTLLSLCLGAPAAQAAEPYLANPSLGAPGTPVVDGANTGEWGPENLIFRGLANDDPRSLGDNWTMHETPWDLTHLYAAWDDEALTLAWQYVDVTDVVDPANAGSAGGTSPRQMDLVQWIAFDTTPDAGSALDMWHKNGGEAYWTGEDLPDHQLYVASNLWQGYLSSAVDGVFPVDDGGVHYFSIEQAGVEVAVGPGFAGVELLGVDDADHATDPAAQRDFLAQGHNGGRDTFYELRIPLAALGLDRAALEAGGLGVMLGQGEGSCLDTLPHDPATLDTPGTSPSNSPLEWGDVDHFTVPFARVATAAGGPVPLPPSDGGVIATPDASGPADAGPHPTGDAAVASPDAGGLPAGDAAGGDGGAGGEGGGAGGPGGAGGGGSIGVPPAQDAGTGASAPDAAATKSPDADADGGGGSGCAVTSAARAPARGATIALALLGALALLLARVYSRRSSRRSASPCSVSRS